MTGYGKCPSCGEEEVVLVGVKDSHGYAYLHIYSAGSVNLCCCLKCGTVFLPEHTVKALRNKG